MKKIVLENFDEGNDNYKINLFYLNREQVEEIEDLVSKWNPTDEDIKSCIGMALTDVPETRFKSYGVSLKECLAWLEKQCKQDDYDDNIITRDDEILQAISVGLTDVVKDAGWSDFGGIPIEDIMDWLEKQVRKKEYTFKSIPRLLDMIEPTESAKAYCQKLIDTLINEGYAADAKIVCKCLKKMCGEKVALATMDEKQGEQKSADKVKVEPKFKVGDWIISKYMHLVMQILNNDNGSYETIETDGTERKDSYDFIERNFKLWTIRDAKNGDVLATKECVFIFKHMDKTGLSLCKSYCEVIGNSKLGFGFYFSINGVHPATKEQRDLLFQRMCEAGYKWDADKKELKRWRYSL